MNPYNKIETETGKVIKNMIDTINAMNFLNDYDASTRKYPTDNSKKLNPTESRHDEWSCQCGNLKGIIHKDSICPNCNTIVKELDSKYGYIIDVESYRIKEEE